MNSARFRPARAVQVLLSILIPVFLGSVALGEQRPGEILVRFAPQTSPAQRSAVLAEHELDLERSAPRVELDLVRTRPGRSSESAIEALQRDPRVLVAQPNYIYRATQISPQDPFLDPASATHQYGPLLVRLPSLWRSTNDGSGRTIAILDSGIDAAHTEFSGRIVPGYDFVNNDTNPNDDFGHGTRVAGVAAAAMNGFGCTGAAPGANVQAVKVLDSTGAGTSLNIISGLAFASGVSVINMSLAGPVEDGLLRAAVAQAYAAGSVLVASTGNGGGSALDFPARWDEVISVGSVGPTTAVSSFSQYGPGLDVVAPGESIATTEVGGVDGMDSFLNSGTSFACPLVAGICALLLNEFPGMRAWEIERFLREHARDVDDVMQGVSGNKDGFGMICFGSLRDWSNGTLPSASSANTFWEWLGAEVTGESSISDTTAIGANDLDDGQPDLDGFTNTSGEDGGDDGVFPASNGLLPLLPPHIASGAQSLLAALSVGNYQGPRWSAGQSLWVRMWADWDRNNVFADDELMASAPSSAPKDWGSNTSTETVPVTPKDEHCRGNPLRIRARVHRPASEGLPNATGAQLFGEVEDFSVINFVEDFDFGTPYATMPVGAGGWVLQVDPPLPGSSYIPHRSLGRYARSVPTCIELVDQVMLLPDTTTGLLDLREMTNARLQLWAAHELFTTCNCTLSTFDNCRITVRRFENSTGPYTEFDLFNFPDPGALECPGGTGLWQDDLDFDLSAYAGYYVQIAIHHNTNTVDHLLIDDVVVFAYDSRAPATATLTPTLLADRTAVLSWSHPNENVPPVAGTGIVPLAAAYATRLSVGGTFDWNSAFRLTPRDFANASSAFPVPGAPGAASAAFRAPTVFPALALGLRTQDEVNNTSADATAGMSVTPVWSIGALGPGGPISAAPGDEVSIDFTVANNSAALDALSITLSDSLSPDWVQSPLERVQVLVGGAGALENVKVRVPISALPGASDVITLFARSLSDGAQTAIATATVVVSGGSSTPICAGDGSGTPCPCNNTGASGRGCENSVLTGGASLAAYGTASVTGDTIVLRGTAMPATASCLYFQGTALLAGGAGVAFGDGIRCVGGSVLRLDPKTNVDGSSSYGGPVGDLPVSVKGQIPAAGGTRYYQIWYRNVADYCTSDMFNLSNAITLTWTP